MAAHQDDKLAKMRTALAVTTGTINDLEPLYVQSLGVAVTEEVTNEAWMEFWDEVLQGPIAQGHWNDRAFTWLADVTDLTDQWAKYWAAP